MIDRLRCFNSKLDEFLIEVSFPLLISGFIMATVDLLQHGQLATDAWFIWLWSVIQAVAIDGVFVAIWLRIFTRVWTRSHIFLVMAGLLMAFVVAIINDLLTFQELYHLADSLASMQKLGIDVATFTHIRAFLVIFVAILLIPLREQKAMEHSQMAMVTPAKRLRKSYKEYAQKATITEEKTTHVAIPERAIAIEKATPPSVKELCIAKWHDSDKSQGVKKAIAEELDIGYSTVKKYLKEGEKA